MKKIVLLLGLLLSAPAFIEAAATPATADICIDRDFLVVECVHIAMALFRNHPDCAARLTPTKEELNFCLREATRTNNKAFVQMLIKKEVINLNEAYKNQTPLEYAALGDHPDIVQILLDAGADVHVHPEGYDELTLVDHLITVKTIRQETPASLLLIIAHGGTPKAPRSFAIFEELKKEMHNQKMHSSTVISTLLQSPVLN